jgi:hypothetical protein
MKDTKLWKAFSEYIRLRDSDENGLIRCITCGRVKPWKECDCGHGIGRQHKATKYHEQNNHAQCKKCNGFEGGMRERYKEEVDKRYGEGTWNKLEVMARGVCKRGQFEIDVLEKYYKQKVKDLIKTKFL